MLSLLTPRLLGLRSWIGPTLVCNIDASGDDRDGTLVLIWYA